MSVPWLREAKSCPRALSGSSPAGPALRSAGGGGGPGGGGGGGPPALGGGGGGAAPAEGMEAGGPCN